MPRIMPEPRYFSIPSTVVGAVAFRNEVLNWTPCVRSLIQVPLAWTNSPAEIIAAWPRTVIKSRWPRAFTRSTQKPFGVVECHPVDEPDQDLGWRARPWNLAASGYDGDPDPGTLPALSPLGGSGGACDRAKASNARGAA